MNPKENSHLSKKREIEESISRTPDKELDPYDFGLGEIEWDSSGKIYCERYDNLEKTLAEEKMLEEQEKQRQRAKAERMMRKQKKKYTVDPSQETYMIVRIRLRNGRTYDVAEVKIKDNFNVETEANELFDHYYHKLGKRFIHVKNPTHHAIRCSSVDDLFINYR